MKDIAKLSRKQITEALDSVPVETLLGKHAKRELTPKQRRFALEIAKGTKGAEAYRRVYSATAKPVTAGNTAHKLKARPDINSEIEAYRLALEAQEYRTPAALRALVIQTLTQTLLNDDVAPAVRVQAAKVLGTVTEVSAFTERKEIRTINDSTKAREQLLNEIKDLMRTVDMPSSADADSLLAELAGSEAHPGGTTPSANATHHGDIHSIPHTQSQNSSDFESLPEEPHPLDIETPPGSDEK